MPSPVLRATFAACLATHNADARDRKAKILALLRAAHRDARKAYRELQRAADRMTGLEDTMTNVDDPTEGWQDVVEAARGLDVRVDTTQALEDFDDALVDDEE